MATVQRTYYRTDVTIGRVLLVIAAVVFVLAAFAAAGDFTGAQWSTLLAIGLAVGFAGLAIG